MSGVCIAGVFPAVGVLSAYLQVPLGAEKLFIFGDRLFFRAVRAPVSWLRNCYPVNSGERPVSPAASLRGPAGCVTRGHLLSRVTVPSPQARLPAALQRPRSCEDARRVCPGPCPSLRGPRGPHDPAPGHLPHSPPGPGRAGRLPGRRGSQRGAWFLPVYSLGEDARPHAENRPSGSSLRVETAPTSDRFMQT